MPNWVYLHIRPRISANISYMLSQKTVERLLDATSPSELQNIFLNTEYNRYFEALDEFTAENVELALRRHFFDIYTSIARSVTGDEAKFFHAFLKIFEVMNLKQILRSKHTQRSIDETMDYLIPVSKYEMEYYLSLLETENLRQTISKITDDNLRDALERAYPLYESTNQIFILESALDRQIYTHLWKIASTWKITNVFGGRERFVLRNLLGEKIDLINILITLRALSLGLNPENFIIPVEYKLTDELNKAIKSTNMREALEIFGQSPHYGPIIARIPKGAPDIISKLEIVFNRYHAKKCKVKLADYPFQIGPIYCFFTLKFFEIHDLKTLVIGKLEGIDSEEIQKLLVLY